MSGRKKFPAVSKMAVEYFAHSKKDVMTLTRKKRVGGTFVQ